MLFDAEEVYIVSFRTTLYFAPFVDLTWGGSDRWSYIHPLWDQTAEGVRTMMLRVSDRRLYPIGVKGLIGPQKIQKES